MPVTSMHSVKVERIHFPSTRDIIGLLSKFMHVDIRTEHDMDITAPWEIVIGEYTNTVTFWCRNPNQAPIGIRLDLAKVLFEDLESLQTLIKFIVSVCHNSVESKSNLVNTPDVSTYSMHEPAPTNILDLHSVAVSELSVNIGAICQFWTVVGDGIYPVVCEVTSKDLYGVDCPYESLDCKDIQSYGTHLILNVETKEFFQFSKHGVSNLVPDELCPKVYHSIDQYGIPILR